jgi:hypothetical protein
VHPASLNLPPLSRFEILHRGVHAERDATPAPPRGHLLPQPAAAASESVTGGEGLDVKHCKLFRGVGASGVHLRLQNMLSELWVEYGGFRI